MELEIRNIEIREVNEEERTISGIAVPFGQTVNVGGYEEAFDRGAIESVTDTKLFWDHKEPIGKVIRGEDTDDGFVIEARISKTPRGEEAYTLLKDGVINKFSVGFLPRKHRMNGETIVRTKVDLKEVSLVSFPAYSDASILDVREASTAEKANQNGKEISIMENEINETAELREAVDTMERRLSALEIEDRNADEAVVYESGGDWLKALARGDENAVKYVKRAYTGGTTTTAGSPLKTGWVDRALKLKEENRKIVNLFDRSALPASGMSIEYPLVKVGTGTAGVVAVQAAEGDDLGYIKLETDTATVSIATYGAYSELSRQVIERSDVAYLDAVLRMQAQQYAKATNAAVRTVLTGGSGYNAPTGVTLASAKGADWVGLTLDCVAAIDDNGLGAQAEFIVVSTDVFRKLVTLSDTTDRPVFEVNNDGSNTIGGVSVKGISGSLAGLPVVVDGGLAAKKFYVASSEAITTWENPGAPVHLTDENIINLSKQFSLYGYLASAVVNAKAVSAPTIA